MAAISTNDHEEKRSFPFLILYVSIDYKKKGLRPIQPFQVHHHTTSQPCHFPQVLRKRHWLRCMADPQAQNKNDHWASVYPRLIPHHWTALTSVKHWANRQVTPNHGSPRKVWCALGWKKDVNRLSWLNL